MYERGLAIPGGFDEDGRVDAGLHWIEAPELLPGRVALGPAPRGGSWLLAEVAARHEAGVQVLVSLLESREAAMFDLAMEAELCRRAGIEFLSFPIMDHGIPGAGPESKRFIQDLVRQVREGRAVLIHCLAGIGRSATIAAGVLLAAGIPLEETLRRLEVARGFAVPETAGQLDWLRRFAAR